MTIPAASISPAVQRALDRAVLLHLFDPNVSLVDLGFRVRDRQDYQVEDELCVRVHVRKKLRGADFRAFAARNPERVVDPDRIGFPVDVPGEARYKLDLQPWYSTAPASFRRRVFNPLGGGISISNALTFGAGTLGGMVIDRQTGDEMILSNWHVLVGSWYAWDGMAIYQPGQLDGGHAAYTVARLTRHAMDQYLDAAVAILTQARPLINDQVGLGPVTGESAPTLGMRVIKSGRTTEVTTGIITSIEGRRAQNYDGVQRVIRHIVHIAQTPSGGPISSAGDSGAWWLDAETRRAVGLHFAGNDFPEYGLAMAMPQVLEALNVTL